MFKSLVRTWASAVGEHMTGVTAVFSVQVNRAKITEQADRSVHFSRRTSSKVGSVMKASPSSLTRANARIELANSLPVVPEREKGTTHWAQVNLWFTLQCSTGGETNKGKGISQV